MPTRAVIDDFLAQRRLAFVGASRNDQHFNTSVYTAFRDHGYDVVPVHPDGATIAGDASVQRLADLSPAVDGVVVMVDHERAADVVEEAAAAGIARVWLYRGVGKGAVSDAAIEAATRNGMSCVDGACPFMFLEPVQNVHAFHRGWRRLTGRLPAA